MMLDRVRPPEWLHEKRCLASAIISAVENLRDSEAFNDLGFRLQMQDNHALTEADDYLNTGISTCICTAPWPDEEDEAPTPEPRAWYGKPASLSQVVVEGHEFLY